MRRCEMNRCVAFAAVVLGLLGSGARAADKAVVWSASDLKWVDNPAMKGAAQAVLWGDPAKGAYGMMRKVPGGTKLGLHTHAHDQRAVMISGSIEFNMEGEPKKAVGAGSYLFIPGGAVHDATCKAGADCVYFEESSGAADFKPVTKK
jgi:quercetin dioxygenase-like cupin family protein